MLVVVLAVGGMPASVVHIVDVIAVWDRDVATPLTVDVLMLVVHCVAGRLAFVVVVLVQSMQVPVVHEVDVVPMWNGDVAASIAMQMIMFDVRCVGRAGHGISPPYWDCEQATGASQF